MYLNKRDSIELLILSKLRYFTWPSDKFLLQPVVDKIGCTYCSVVRGRLPHVGIIVLLGLIGLVWNTNLLKGHRPEKKCFMTTKDKLFCTMVGPADQAREHIHISASEVRPLELYNDAAMLYLLLFFSWDINDVRFSLFYGSNGSVVPGVCMYLWVANTCNVSKRLP